MSLSESPNYGDSFDELSQQSRRTQINVSASNLSGGEEDFCGGPPNLKPPNNNNPIERNQAAELVALQFHAFSVSFTEEQGAGTQPGLVELELDMTQQADTDAGKQQIKQTTASNGLFQNVNEIINNGLFEMSIFASQSWNDTPNAVGGGGSETSLGLHIVNYRDEFGRGPMFYHGDELGVGYCFHTWNVSNEGVIGTISYTAHWDVFNIEERELENIYG